MPGKAKRRYPLAFCYTVFFSVYKEVSEHIREIFSPPAILWVIHQTAFSLDEAYLDVTENKRKYNCFRDCQSAKRLRVRLRMARLHTASGGRVDSINLLQSCFRMQKPDGLTFIHPEKNSNIHGTINSRKISRHGKVTAEMNKAGFVPPGADLSKLSLDELIKQYGTVKPDGFNTTIHVGAVDIWNQTRNKIGECRYFRRGTLSILRKMEAELDKEYGIECFRRLEV